MHAEASEHTKSAGVATGSAPRRDPPSLPALIPADCPAWRGGHWQVLLAAGMSKRKANSSFYNVKDDTLFWRVE